MKENETDKLQKELIEEAPAVSNYQSIGQTLKAARLDNGMDVDQVCNQLNLSSHVIEALESDNYEGLPEMAYVRGYIVSYCRLLKLDSFQILQQLVTNDPALSVSHSMTSSITGQASNNSSGETIKKILPLVLILTVLGGLGTVLYQQRESLPFIGNLLSSQEDELEQASSVNNLNSSDSSIVSDSTTPESASVDQADATQGEVVVNTPAIQVPVDAEKESLLELEFNAVSWVDIQDLNKEKIVYQSFPRGEKHEVKAELPLNIFIDNAEGVFLRYEGRLIDLKPYIQEGYAKFTLSQ